MRRLLPIVLACLLDAVASSSLAASASCWRAFARRRGTSSACISPARVFLWCSIGRAEYARKLTAYCAQPKIGVDWAGFTLGTKSKGSVECSGGTLYDPANQHPRYTSLGYGKAWRHGAFRCASAVTGVSCRNPAGHGLFVSRQSWRAF